MHLQKRQIQFFCILTVPLIAIVRAYAYARERREEKEMKREGRVRAYTHKPNKHDKGGRGRPSGVCIPGRMYIVCGCFVL